MAPIGARAAASVGDLHAARALGLGGDAVEVGCHAPSEEILMLRPATAAISLSIPLKIQPCTG